MYLQKAGNMSNPVKKRQFAIDKLMVLILVLYAGTSLLALYASAPHLSGGLSEAKVHIIRQGAFFGMGFVSILILVFMGKEMVYGIFRMVYFVLMFALIVLLLQKYGILRLGFIRPVGGTYAWYQFPGFSFQPSEFMKIVLIVITSKVIQDHNRTREEMTFKSDLLLFLKVGKWVIPPLLLIFLQPDTGVPFIIIISLIIMLLMSGIRREWFIMMAIILVCALVFVVYSYYFKIEWLEAVFGTNYRLRRFYGWLDYEKYYQTYGWQLYSSLIALGNAGSSGLGAGNSVIPIAASHTDFIFSVFGSAFGFIGSLWLVFLSIILDLRLIHLTIRSKNFRLKYILSGVLGIFVYQQLQNIMMVVGILPITGITLPLISYGGSSLISYMFTLSFAFIAYNEIKNEPGYGEAVDNPYV